jgi:ketosteroid isomerase-like protein
MKTLIALAFIPVALFAQQPEADAGLDRLRAALVEAFNKQDIEGTLSHLTPDVTVTWQNAEVNHGPAEVRAYYTRMMSGDKRIVREVKCDPKILGRQMHGDWAVSWGNLNDHFTLMDGSDLPFNSTFTATTMKSGDKWLVTSFHVSVNAFENPVLKLAVRKTAWWLGGGALAAGLLGGFLLGRKKRA